MRELQLLVASAPIGKVVPVEILRDGRRLSVNVTVTARDDRKQVAVAEPAAGSWLGMTVREGGEGLEIADVASGSVAQRGGVRPGRTVVLLVRRDDMALYLALPVPKG